MLLLHQAGSVKVGEVARYTISYTPSADRIVPPPKELHVKIKNTASIALRAAYLHGPYTIHVAAYPNSFNPNRKFETIERDGAPQFEPNLKAGNHWHATLKIPQDVQESSSNFDRAVNAKLPAKSVTWTVEIASQVLFSNTATVSYEVVVGRDARSLDLGFASVAGKGYGGPGELAEMVEATSQTSGKVQIKGVYSRAIRLKVEDTKALWNKPPLPSIDDPHADEGDDDADQTTTNTEGLSSPATESPQRKIHLVILTHGLHSNLGADMLYMKESIDEAAAEAAKQRKQRKNSATSKPTDQEQSKDDEQDMDEEVIVRGFPGNAVRTERGIQYLGKRLAKYILTLTYPHQPYLPPSKSITRSLTGSLSFQSGKLSFARPQGSQDSTSGVSKLDPKRLPYRYTSISFIGHSLGGNIQTYAIAYIHKHSPEFFSRIRPVNFITMASPLLGLNNENPIYVKFALDFGLVGRTGRDLGLAWKGPNIRSGWTAMISGFGGGNSQPKEPQEEDPRSKPLLRILPTGPAHHILRKFRNRTVYANVVNDGIVPLRTSCLLFLDWRSLDRVENAQREAGVLTRVAAFGWNELMGASSSNSHRPKSNSGISQTGSSPGDSDLDYGNGSSDAVNKSATYQPLLSVETQAAAPTKSAAEVSALDAEPSPHQFLNQDAVMSSSTFTPSSPSTKAEAGGGSEQTSGEVVNPFSQFLNFFKAEPAKQPEKKPHKVSKKTTEKFKRAQTVQLTGKDVKADKASEKGRPRATRGDSLENDPSGIPPPKTSIFEAATDIIAPPMPDDDWILDPSQRARSIFHDRVYHPSDIPPPSTKKPKTIRSQSTGSLQSDLTAASRESEDNTSGAGMRVEEKIARAYHKDLSWRKVLVRLEPDAHNNIIVRRMFANAYGWDVVKHLCDSHFSDTYASKTEDARESNVDRVRNPEIAITEDAEEVKGQTDHHAPKRSQSELREADDEIKDLRDSHQHTNSPHMSMKRLRHQPSEDSWDERIFDGSDDDADSDDEVKSPFDKFHSFWADGRKPNRRYSIQNKSQKQRKDSEAVPPPAEADIADAMSSPAPTKETKDQLSSSLIAEQARPGAIVPGDDVPLAGIDTSAIGLQQDVGKQVRAPTSGVKSTSSLTEQIGKMTLTKPDKEETGSEDRTNAQP